MLPIKHTAAVGAIATTGLALAVAIHLTDRNHVTDRSDAAYVVQTGSLTPGSSDNVDGVREQVASLTTHVEALQQQLSTLRQARSREADLAGRVDGDWSNPVDSGQMTDNTWYVPDQSERAYFARQQRDLAESEFRMQESDSQWAIATSNQVYDRLTIDQAPSFPGDSADLASLADSLECRANTCRLEIAGTDEDRMAALQLQLFARTAGLFSAGTIHHTDSGGVVFFMHDEPE